MNALHTKFNRQKCTFIKPAQKIQYVVRQAIRSCTYGNSRNIGKFESLLVYIV